MFLNRLWLSTKPLNPQSTNLLLLLLPEAPENTTLPENTQLGDETGVAKPMRYPTLRHSWLCSAFLAVLPVLAFFLTSTRTCASGCRDILG